MKYIIVLFALIILSGCSLAAHSVKDVDKHITEMVAPDTVTTECIAGFYSGIAFGTDNLKISKAVTELDKLANVDSAEYKRCRAKGLEVSILAILGKENLDDAMRRVLALGLF
jgi:hypothetical protein